VNSGDEIQALSKTLNQMIARLEESFQASSRFTSDASHELRTPLTIIQGELEALLLDNHLSNALRDGLESLLEEAQRLGKIVEGLLSLSRLDAGAGQMERTRFDLSELVENTSEQMCLLADEKAITVNIVTKDPVEVEGDKGRLKQVVVNLLDNAIKYTPAGGKVDVYVTAKQGRACLEVVDNGRGITAEALPYVFDRFYRAANRKDEMVDGAGLGLSIVKAICTAHGGSVIAGSIPEGGSRITVEIPLAGKNLI
jgi:signal transduction histidine kinase